jgi:hypothetical protein
LGVRIRSKQGGMRETGVCEIWTSMSHRYLGYHVLKLLFPSYASLCPISAGATSRWNVARLDLLGWFRPSPLGSPDSDSCTANPMVRPARCLSHGGVGWAR